MSAKEKTGDSVEGTGGLKVSLTDFCSNATIHGLRNITDSQFHVVFRVLWCLFVLLMLSTLLYILVHMRIEQLKYPTTTKITTEVAETFDFPAVTVCNKSPYNRFKIKMTPTMEHYMTKLSIYSWHLPKIPWNESEYIKIDKENMTEWHDKASFAQYELIPSCFFGEHFQPCQDIQKSETDIGRCYTFNKNRTHKVESVGRESALKLTMMVSEDQYVPSDFASAGILLGVHDANVDPSIVTKTASHMSGGTDVYISVRPVKTVYLPKPYKVRGKYCFDDKTDINPLKYHDTYSETICQKECIFEEVLKKCGCTKAGTEDEWRSPACSRRQYQECFIPQFGFIASNLSKEKYTRCGECPPSCESTFYETSISTSVYPSDQTATVLAKIFNPANFSFSAFKNRLRKSFLKVNVYFDTLAETRIEYHPVYTWENIAVQLGGYMGLFLGASVLSVLEIIQFLLSATCRCMGKRLALSRDGNKKKVDDTHIQN